MTLAWARGKGRATQPDPDAPVWPVLAELEIYTDSRRLIGWIAPEGERTSDWINRANELELIGAVETGVADERPQLPEPSAGAARTRIPASEIILAVPPELPQGRHLRLHRRVVRVRFQMEGYQLSGKIHVRPGAEVGEYLLRSSRVFVPITDAELVHQREPQFVRLLPVAIMNARYVSRIHLFDGSPEPATAAPVSPSAAERAAEVAVPAAPSLSPPAPNLAAAPILPTRESAVAAAAPAPQVPPPQPPGPTIPAVQAEEPVPFRMSDIEPVGGSVHRALSELAALHRDGLVTDAEFEAKRSEILSRL